MMRAANSLLAMLLLSLSLCTWAEDWPAFMGPNTNGTAPDTGINKNWSQKPPQVLWKVPLGDNGYAGPSVADGKVFIIDHAGDQDIVRALSLETGEEVWRFPYADTSKHYYGFARATPVFCENRLYTLSRLGLLHCLNAQTGEKLWLRNIRTEFNGSRPKWDYAASPLVDGDKLIVCPGGPNAGVAALNRRTGETIWTGGGSEVPGYATPVIATLQGRKQYVVFTSASLIGVDAAGGQLLWRVPWKTGSDVNAAMPIVGGNFIFITSGYKHGCGLIEITPQGPVVHWTNTLITSHFSSPIYYGYVYGTGDSGRLVCLHSGQGVAMWQQPGFTKGGMVGVDGVIIVMDDRNGDVVMFKASPDSYQELGRIRPLGGQSWTAPIIAHGKLIVRNKQALACLDLM